MSACRCGRAMGTRSTRCKNCYDQDRAYSVSRFWASVDRSGGPDACWPWTGPIAATGYGRFSEDNTAVAAHRRAFLLTHGAIPVDLWVLHRCDNRPCCNPAHLYAGTATDNNRDTRDHGRLTVHRGEDSSAAKLTRDQVAEIRAEYNPRHVPERVFADRFGVTRAAVYRVARGETWKTA